MKQYIKSKLSKFYYRIEHSIHVIKNSILLILISTLTVILFPHFILNIKYLFPLE